MAGLSFKYNIPEDKSLKSYIKEYKEALRDGTKDPGPLFLKKVVGDLDMKTEESKKIALDHFRAVVGDLDNVFLDLLIDAKLHQETSRPGDFNEEEIFILMHPKVSGLTLRRPSLPDDSRAASGGGGSAIIDIVEKQREILKEYIAQGEHPESLNLSLASKLKEPGKREVAPAAPRQIISCKGGHTIELKGKQLEFVRGFEIITDKERQNQIIRDLFNENKELSNKLREYLAVDHVDQEVEFNRKRSIPNAGVAATQTAASGSIPNPAAVYLSYTLTKPNQLTFTTPSEVVLRELANLFMGCNINFSAASGENYNLILGEKSKDKGGVETKKDQLSIAFTSKSHMEAFAGKLSSIAGMIEKKSGLLSGSSILLSKDSLPADSNWNVVAFESAPSVIASVVGARRLSGEKSKAEAIV